MTIICVNQPTFFLNANSFFTHGSSFQIGHGGEGSNQMAEMNDSTIFHEHVRMMRCVIIAIHIADKLQKQLNTSVS
jgi:hypothetical protein